MSRGLQLAMLERHGVTVIQANPDGTMAQSEAQKFGGVGLADSWYCVAVRGTELHPDCWNLVVAASQRRPDVGIFYGDSVTVSQGDDAPRLSLKPDWDLTLLLAADYIGLPLFIKAKVAGQIGAIDVGQHTAAAFDLLLRAHSGGVAIGRIQEVLACYTGAPFAAAVADRRSAIASWPHSSARQYDAGPGLTPTSLRFDRRFQDDAPEVTLVVPTRQASGPAAEAGQGRPFVREFLDSVAKSGYPMDKLHVLIGDDIESDAAYAGGSWPFRLQRIVTRRAPGEAFNYAAKMNRLWRAAGTEHVVLMNDDITIRSADWLQALLSFSMQADVGGAGARLLYPDGRIQHAGMPGGVYGLCTHAWIGQPAEAATYEDWALLHREWSMVTGAVFATRKGLLEEVNGFDERLTLDFNDVDLCMRLKMLGYRIVYTPHAELVHHEKSSRGDATWPASELALFLRRWQQFLDNDPSFNAGLSKSTHIVQPIEPHGQWWQGR